MTYSCYKSGVIYNNDISFGTALYQHEIYRVVGPQLTQDRIASIVELGFDIEMISFNCKNIVEDYIQDREFITALKLSNIVQLCEYIEECDAPNQMFWWNDEYYFVESWMNTVLCNLDIVHNSPDYISLFIQI